jgi:hypothetical protein
MHVGASVREGRRSRTAVQDVARVEDPERATCGVGERAA